jgi:mannosyltransferase OCH1-like enzyme
MIPKVIHYCWFGRGPKSKLIQKCIQSWKKYLPDYQIVEWNESNFDIYSNTFARQAYTAKKYALIDPPSQDSKIITN